MSTTSSEVMHVRFRTVDGITIRYAESDERQDNPMLLTNPWPESLYAFLPIWQTLSQHSYLLAIDLPGFGQSERRNDLLSPRAMGEFLIRLIDEWGLNTPHIVAPDVEPRLHCSPQRCIPANCAALWSEAAGLPTRSRWVVY